MRALNRSSPEFKSELGAVHPLDGIIFINTKVAIYDLRDITLNRVFGGSTMTDVHEVSSEEILNKLLEIVLDLDEVILPLRNVLVKSALKMFRAYKENPQQQFPGDDLFVIQREIERYQYMRNRLVREFPILKEMIESRQSLTKT